MTSQREKAATEENGKGGDKIPALFLSRIDMLSHQRFAKR